MMMTARSNPSSAKEDGEQKKKKKLRPFNKLLRRVGNPIKSTRLACSIIPFFKNPDDRCDFNNNNQAHAIKGILPPPAR